MMNDTDLIEKALKAGRDYRRVYGKFPDEIGIHRERLAEMRNTHIGFARLVNEKEFECAPEGYPETSKIEQHVAKLIPILGDKVDWNEIYLLDPGNETRFITAEEIAEQAKKSLSTN